MKLKIWKKIWDFLNWFLVEGGAHVKFVTSTLTGLFSQMISSKMNGMKLLVAMNFNLTVGFFLFCFVLFCFHL